MAQIQKYFEEFHEIIKLGRFEENETLREKRDIIRDKVKEKLPAIFEEEEEECPEYSWRDQGSYEMETGIKPLDGDFDIDQGLYFEVSPDDYSDPVVLKKRVYKALEGHTKRVEIRHPCVTVFYQIDDEPIYHVDIAIYSDSSKNLDGKSRIAKGKENSTEEYRYWEASDPQALSDLIFSRFTENDRSQFRRIVRYMKRWKDNNFSSSGYAAPIGIGLTVAAYNDFQPTYTDIFAGKANDLEAIRKLTYSMLNRFQSVWNADEQRFFRRLIVTLPVEPRCDLFERMTDRQMEQFEAKLTILRDKLDAATAEVDPVEACKILAEVFGDDFPVPAQEQTAKRHSPAIVSSSNSA